MSDKKHKVRIYYDNFAKDYDSFYEKIQFEKYKYIFSLIDLQEYEFCIDVGGGTGLLSKYIQKEMLVIDLSYDMIREVLSNKRSKLLLVADMTSLPIRKTSFNTVFSFTAVQNSILPSNMLKEVSRILRNDPGNFIVSTLEKIIDKSSFSLLCNKAGLTGKIFNFPIEDIGYSNLV